MSDCPCGDPESSHTTGEHGQAFLEHLVKYVILSLLGIIWPWQRS